MSGSEGSEDGRSGRGGSAGRRSGADRRGGGRGGGSSRSRDGGGKRGGSRSADRTRRDERTRSRDRGAGRDRRDEPRRKEPPKTITTSAGSLPGWAADEVQRMAQRGMGRPAVEHLAAAVEAFVAGKYGKASRSAEAAKELAPRSPTIREVLGLSAYRLGRWDAALRELKTYRRFTGETWHVPVEMDVLRALDRPDEVARTWDLLQRLGGARQAMDEGKVVYASFLLDRDDASGAWRVANPGRIGNDPSESELRVWYVAARAAARSGDRATARRLYEAVQGNDPAFPGLDELERVITDGA